MSWIRITLNRVVRTAVFAAVASMPLTALSQSCLDGFSNAKGGFGPISSQSGRISSFLFTPIERHRFRNEFAAAFPHDPLNSNSVVVAGLHRRALVADTKDYFEKEKQARGGNPVHLGHVLAFAVEADQTLSISLAERFRNGFDRIREQVPSAIRHVVRLKDQVGDISPTHPRDPEVLMAAVGLAVDQLVTTGRIQAHDAIYPALPVLVYRGSESSSAKDLESSRVRRTVTYKDARDVLPTEQVSRKSTLSSASSFSKDILSGRMPLVLDGSASIDLSRDLIQSPALLPRSTVVSSMLLHDLLSHFLPLLNAPESFAAMNTVFRDHNFGDSGAAIKTSFFEKGLIYSPHQLFRSRELLREADRAITGEGLASYLQWFQRQSREPSLKRATNDVFAIYGFWRATLLEARRNHPSVMERLKQIAMVLPEPIVVGGATVLKGVLKLTDRGFHKSLQRRPSPSGSKLLDFFSLQPNLSGQLMAPFAYQARMFQTILEAELGEDSAFDSVSYDIWLSTLLTTSMFLTEGESPVTPAAKSALQSVYLESLIVDRIIPDLLARQSEIL